MSSIYLQDQMIPDIRCFGCGPANPQGLQLKTVLKDDEIVGDWTPQPHHESIMGILSSGVIAGLLDCAASWACIMHVKKEKDLEGVPTMVTKEFAIKLLKPAYIKNSCSIRSRVIETDGRRVTAVSEILQDGAICATCTLVSVILDLDFDISGR